MAMAIKVGNRSIDEFEIWLWLQMCGETDKPQWVAMD